LERIAAEAGVANRLTEKDEGGGIGGHKKAPPMNRRGYSCGLCVSNHPTSFQRPRPTFRNSEAFLMAVLTVV